MNNPHLAAPFSAPLNPEHHPNRFREPAVAIDKHNFEKLPVFASIR